MSRCHIALGGNVGDVRATFARALQSLAGSDLRVVAVSRAYCTAAVGELAGDPFLNAAAAVETDLEPHALLERLQDVENSLGRMRETRWGPRPIDLDLILYGKQTIDEARLTVPHPAAWYRRFVLDPLAEIAADVVHPVKRVTVQELSTRLLPRPLEVRVTGGGTELKAELIARLRTEFPSVEIQNWEPAAQNAPAILFWLGSADAEHSGMVRFEELPLLPRLDASAFCGSINELTEFARGVLQGALDEPVVDS